MFTKVRSLWHYFTISLFLMFWSVGPSMAAAVGHDVIDRGSLDVWMNFSQVDLSLSFTNSGQIDSWSIYAKSTGNIYLQIYRHISGNTYKVVGENHFVINSLGVNNLSVSNSDKIVFQPGDYIGWTFSSLSDARIAYDYGSTNVVLWPSSPGQFALGVGSQLNFSNSGNRTYSIAVNTSIASVPTADAGLDQIVNEGATVILNGSESSDPDGDPLTYQWVQIAGVPVSLNLTDPVRPTFTAPSVPTGGATLTFQLTVSDGQLTSSPDIVNILVKNVNHIPVSNAGIDQAVAEGASVQLDGSASYDRDGESLVYHWSQTGGPLIQLSDPATIKLSFTAPFVGPDGATLTFELSISDGIDNAVDTVNILVENVNHVPVANAGIDQTKNEGSLIPLDGTASIDPDTDSLVFNWTQISGQPVVLSDPHSSTPVFTAPLVGLGGETLVFQLIVNDDLADSMPDQVSINLLNINDPPACELARAVPALLWPPNHKMVSVNISGIADPNNDNVAIRITKVTQNEPVNSLGDGDTSLDAAIQGESVLLRAERSGKGNGRVYQVYFSADDGQGGVCNGSVKVSVPHSKSLDAVIDDGQFYDSTQP